MSKFDITFTGEMAAEVRQISNKKLSQNWSVVAKANQLNDKEICHLLLLRPSLRICARAELAW